MRDQMDDWEELFGAINLLREYVEESDERPTDAERKRLNEAVRIVSEKVGVLTRPMLAGQPTEASRMAETAEMMRENGVLRYRDGDFEVVIDPSWHPPEDGSGDETRELSDEEKHRRDVDANRRRFRHVRLG